MRKIDEIKADIETEGLPLWCSRYRTELAVALMQDIPLDRLEEICNAEREGWYVVLPEECPEIVCLCGSTRFYDAFQKANYEFTMQGKIVLSVGFYPHSTEQAHGQAIGCTPEQKVALDELHKRKIDLADRIHVLNVGGYVGESTRSEIDYAVAHGKTVSYLEAAEAAKGEQP